MRHHTRGGATAGRRIRFLEERQQNRPLSRFRCRLYFKREAIPQ
jgi:hypothetical protein